MKNIYVILLCLTIVVGIKNSYAQSTVPSSIEASFPVYLAGDSITFDFTSANFSATDKIALYPTGVLPGANNPALDSKYIPSASGTLTFKTTLTSGLYVAYLICCDSYDTLASAPFEVMDADAAYLVPKRMAFDAGTTIEFAYNDPLFATNDQIYIYPDGEIPGSNAYLTHGSVAAKSGVVSFPGVLPEGVYFAVMFCCGATTTQYARSDQFVVNASTTGSYVKTSSAVYPTSSSIFVNYKDMDLQAKDWIGIYKKGETPGGPESKQWQYVTKDSATIEFQSLPLGEYVVYLLCCDGYNVKARTDFKVVGPGTASLVLSSFSVAVGEPIEFLYNDPNFVGGNGADWIGIYNPGDIPENIRSSIWSYLTAANGTETYKVPYANGTWPEENPDTPLVPGDYVAYLFCCDLYTVYASTAFTVTEFPSGTSPVFKSKDIMNLFPNPTTGLVNIQLKEGRNMQRILVYNVTGQVVYEEKPIGSVNSKVLDLKLGKGIYFLEVLTDHHKTSKKLIIQ